MNRSDDYTLSIKGRLHHTQRALEPFWSDGVDILDVGSRDGRSMDAMPDTIKPGRLVALDYHHRVENGIEFIKHNLEQPLSFEDNSFDCVICTDVIEHVENKHQLTRELARVSRKGVIVSLPNTQHRGYVRGLRRGNMGVKFNFAQDDGLDRHRWITYYDDNIAFFDRYFDIKYRVDICDQNKRHLMMAKYRPKSYVRNMFFACEVSASKSGQ